MSTNAPSLPISITNLVEGRKRKRYDVFLVAISVALALVVASLFLPANWIGAASAGDEIFLGP